jgi:hypothetical protein
MSNKEYAFIKDNLVFDILIFDNPSDELLNIFKDEKDADSVVLATEAAIVGGEYDGTTFWRIKPYPTWIKDMDKKIWVPPIPYPEVDSLNPKTYFWHEDKQEWVEASPIPEDE